jgi:hypothetical protein
MYWIMILPYAAGDTTRSRTDRFDHRGIDAISHGVLHPSYSGLAAISQVQYNFNHFQGTHASKQ